MDASYLRELLDYDRATGIFVWRITTSNGKGGLGKQAGSFNGDGYRQIAIDRTTYKAHRLAWLHVHGEWPSGDLDHINGKRDDNRFVNLRLATRHQNGANRAKHTNNTSGFKGVHLHRRSGKWRATIVVVGKHQHLGVFLSAEEAHAAYCFAAQKAFGDFWRAA